MSLKEKIQSGKKIYGTMLRILRNPASCYLIKNGGLDFVMYDCEHSNYDMQTLHDLFITGNSLGYDSFLRVPDLTKDYISRALDQGARGVMVPMLETAEMALKLVEYSKFKPIGNRGVATSLGYTNYDSASKLLDVMEKTNNTTISIAQIETKLAVENAEIIASTPGIDALLIGPNDLSLSLGIPGDVFNKVELEAISHVAAACKKHNKAFGIHAGPKMLDIFYEDLTIVMCQTDTEILTSGFRAISEIFAKRSDK